MNVRNFCIIAHIDHGKSTLADRLLEFTGAVSKREMKEQLLDTMDLERERGITIKLQPVRMDYIYGKTPFTLNLIDTPGHVDFTYEVSRSLAAVEGAILLVDATQGIQAQTLANLYLALDQNIKIIPVLNKIDLPGARIPEITEEIVTLLGCGYEDVLAVSAKTGQGIEALLAAVIDRVPPPRAGEANSLRALIFDSVYDEYRGVVAYVRIFDGDITPHQQLYFKAAKSGTEALEVGYFKPRLTTSTGLSTGEIGYIVTGFKNVKDCRVGDTVTLSSSAAKDIEALPGYKEVMPMVFAGLFCRDGAEFQMMREAVEKLKVNDAAFTFEIEHSPALGYGFRGGFLGLLHLEIIQERLRREYNLELIVTVPSVEYHVTTTRGEDLVIHSPLELPDPGLIATIQEPWVRADIIAPESCIGGLLSIATEKKGIYKNTEYLSSSHQGDKRVILHFELPLSSILVDFYDKIKSVSAGYASMNYDFLDYREADVVRLDIVVAEEPVEALASIVYRDNAYYIGRTIVTSLAETLPRQMFEIKIQATIGAKVVASDRISAMRKDVVAGLYGGDATRKQKLLEKQKKGKKRMQKVGKVDIPTEAYLSVLKL